MICQEQYINKIIKKGVVNFLKESDDDTVSNEIFLYQDLNNLSHVSKSKEYAIFKKWASFDWLKGGIEPDFSTEQIAEAMGKISFHLQGLEGGLDKKDEKIIEEARIRMKMNYYEFVLAENGIHNNIISTYNAEDQIYFKDFIEFMEEKVEGKDFSLGK